MYIHFSRINDETHAGVLTFRSKNKLLAAHHRVMRKARATEVNAGTLVISSGVIVLLLKIRDITAPRSYSMKVGPPSLEAK